MEEVRYQCLRPAQIVKRVKECPIAYIPLGNLEWHGFHLPMGVDSFLAEELAIRCARLGGGLAMPALHWGDNRIEGIIDADVHPEEIAAAMEWKPDACSLSKWRQDEFFQNRLYLDLLLHILNQCENYGFKVATLLCGHAPHTSRAAQACLEYNTVRSKTGRMLAWNTLALLHYADQYPGWVGGHATYEETSQMLYAHPGLVDLTSLPEDGSLPLGTFGPKAANDADPAFGEESLRFAAEDIAAEAKKRLNNQAPYRKLGSTIRIKIEP